MPPFPTLMFPGNEKEQEGWHLNKLHELAVKELKACPVRDAPVSVKV